MLENKPYCPVLHARVAELKALLNLPAISKDRIFPILVARPWPNANHLIRTWEKIVEALDDRQFALDLDTTRFRSNSNKQAATDFDLLFNPNNGFENYYALIQELRFSVPVLRTQGDTAPDLARQLSHVENLDRGLLLRLNHETMPHPIQLARTVLDSFEDIVIVIDAGWSRDLLNREMWVSNIIQSVTDVKPEAEIVVCGSSFPESFAEFGTRGNIRLYERRLFSSLVRQHNAATLIYGDWGSTRPPAIDTVPMSTPPRRIDLPKADEWICFRQDTDESYAEIAKRTIEDASWPQGLDIWGTYMVRCTAEEVPGAIRSPGTAAASRINIHLHTQAHFDSDAVVNDGDEPFVD